MTLQTFRYLLLAVTFTLSVSSCKKRKGVVEILFRHHVGNAIEESQIISYKEDLMLIAELKTNGKTIRQVKLTEGYIPLIPLFINELEALGSEQKCSTNDRYRVSFNDKIITKDDRTCEWDGFERLRFALFGLRK